MGRLLLVAVVGLALIGCGSDDKPAKRHDTATACEPKKDLDDGTSTATITFEGAQRTYLIHVPDGYDGSARTPVVFLFHGLGGNSAAVVETTQMDEEADRSGFILVAPQGAGDITHWDYLTPASTKGSDLALVDKLVDDVKQKACVDDDRVFASGFSNGSLLTLALACSAADEFAAFGGVSGPVAGSKCSDAPARPIIYFHGTNDTVVPFTGAKTLLGTFPPVTRALTTWAAHNGCAPTPVRSTTSKTVQKSQWNGCDDGDLTAYVVDGGGHRWPGGVRTDSGQDAGAMTESIDATALIWKFFTKHPAN